MKDQIYLIASGRDVIKVGIASDVRKRLRGLQTGAAYALHVMHQIEVDAAHSRTLEKLIHKALKPHHMRGEWFRVAPGKAIRVANDCADRFHRELLAAASAQMAEELCPGTVTRNGYCPECFNRDSTIVPIGTMPDMRCTQCGKTMLVAGRDPIRPWWKARAINRKR